MEPTPPPRPMRADARRNYQRIVAVARDAFAEHGPEAPLDDIARRAEVGPGTLYRHFPDRDALIEAVYRSDMERLSRRAYELLETRSPGDALMEWMRDEVRFVVDKRGLATTFKAAIDRGSVTFEICRGLITDAAEALLKPAQAEGTIRPELQARDLLLLGHGVGVASESNPEARERLLNVMLDGLRPPAR